MKQFLTLTSELVTLFLEGEDEMLLCILWLSNHVSSWST